MHFINKLFDQKHIEIILFIIKGHKFQFPAQVSASIETNLIINLIKY